MDDRTLKIYHAISNFVSCLHEKYGSHNKPLALYNRLITRTSIKDIEPIQKHIKCFDIFISKYRKKLMVDQIVLPDNACIKYSERVYIDLPFLIKKSDKDTLYIIRQHLLTISALLHPDDSSSLQKLEEKLEGFNIDTSSAEGEFISNMMEDLQDADLSNPASLFSMVPKLFTGLKDGVESGEMNIGGLMNAMQGVMGSLMGQSPPSSQNNNNNTKSEVKNNSTIQDNTSKKKVSFVASKVARLSPGDAHSKKTRLSTKDANTSRCVEIIEENLDDEISTKNNEVSTNEVFTRQSETLSEASSNGDTTLNEDVSEENNDIFIEEI